MVQCDEDKDLQYEVKGYSNEKKASGNQENEEKKQECGVQRSRIEKTQLLIQK